MPTLAVAPRQIFVHSDKIPQVFRDKMRQVVMGNLTMHEGKRVMDPCYKPIRREMIPLLGRKRVFQGLMAEIIYCRHLMSC